MNPFLIMFISAILLIVGLYIYDKKRNKDEVGSIVITKDPETQKILFSLEMDVEPDDIMFMDEVVFKVDNRI